MIQDATGLNSTPLELFVVIVLYKIKPDESPSLRTLQAAIAHLTQGRAKIKVLLYDNTPGGQQVDIPMGIEYVADVENGGLAKAYNYAITLACKGRYNWLLTLDQDTKLPYDFLEKLFRTASFVYPIKNIGAIVPSVTGNDRIISPCFHRKYCPRTLHLSDGFIGISLESTWAINSASAFRVSALRTIGGYDQRFPLWHSDIVAYHRLESAGFRVFVAGNIQVEHDLSVFDLKNKSTPARYEDMLYAEGAYCDEYLGIAGCIVLLMKIYWRLGYRLWTMGPTVIHFKIILKFLCKRLLCSRRHRVRAWKQSCERFN